MPGRRRTDSRARADARATWAETGSGRGYAALLAAELALSLGDDAVVCLYCPVEPLEDEQLPLLVVALPPLTRLPVPSNGVLLVVLDFVVSGGPSAHMAGDGIAAARLAKARVPEVWLWRGPEEWLERLSMPVAGYYRQRELLLPGEAVLLPRLRQVVTLP